MEIELDHTLISSGSDDWICILALIHFGYQRRHIVITDGDASWDTWIQQLSSPLRDEVQVALEIGLTSSALGSVHSRVRVVSSTSTQAPMFSESEFTLSATDALRVASAPLRVLLENGRNDRAFLLAFADDLLAASLREAESSGWLVFETAGGIGELKVRLEDAASAPFCLDNYRLMYLCDSDALEPGHPSEDAQSVASHMKRLANHFNLQPRHFGAVLSRRAAENYAPPSDVLRWAHRKLGLAVGSDLINKAQQATTRAQLTLGSGAAGSSRRCLLAAIALREVAQLPDVVGHMDMKKGRRDAAGRTRTADSVWNLLDEFQKAALFDGFGSSFSSDFFGQHQRLTDSTGEIDAILKTVLERI